MGTTSTRIASLAATFLLTVGACGTGAETTSGPPTVVFDGDVECRTATGASSCGFVVCDFVPEGRTLDEVCGVNFQEGVQVTDPDWDRTWPRFLVDQLARCAIVRIDDDGRWTRDDGIALSVQGSSVEVEDAVTRAVDDCGTVDDR